MILGLHHFGFAVTDLEAAVRLYESTGFSVFKRFVSEERGLRAVMMKKGKSHVELFNFDDPDSALSKKISRHFAFESDNLEDDVQRYIDAGYTISIPIDKGTVVKRYAYVEDKLGNQIELLEKLDEDE